MASLEQGLPRQTVRRRLGPPLLQTPFHPHRWDYVFYQLTGDGERAAYRRLTIFFNAAGRVQRLVQSGDPYPQAYSPESSSP